MNDLEDYPPFASVEDWCHYARRTSVSAIEDAALKALLQSASKEIRRVCEWQIWPRVSGDVLTLDGRGAREQLLPVLNVSAVASVVENGVTLVEDTDYEWSRSGILTRLNGFWTARRRKLVVTCTHGYANNPSDLRDLVCTVAGRALPSATGAIREQAGAVAVTYSQTAPGVAGGVVLLAHERRSLGAYMAGTR